jgi:hypothetical protein
MDTKEKEVVEKMAVKDDWRLNDLIYGILIPVDRLF